VRMISRLERPYAVFGAGVCCQRDGCQCASMGPLPFAQFTNAVTLAPLNSSTDVTNMRASALSSTTTAQTPANGLLWPEIGGATPVPVVWTAGTGSLMVKVAPFPSPSLSAVTLPPCISTSYRVSESPSPRPPARCPPDVPAC
jgi:hypothetical protein